MSEICWLMIGDGRDETHERSLVSAKAMLPQPDGTVVVDDTDHKLGFAGALQQGWERVLDTDADYVVHLELDFLLRQPVPVKHLVALLERRPYLTQVVLKRQACNPGEQAAGGVVEQHPDDFRQVHDGGYVFTEHSRFFSTNPSVYPAALCSQGWPQTAESEGVFSHRLFDNDPAARSCFWGAKFDPPLCTHIGERAGTGY